MGVVFCALRYFKSAYWRVLGKRNQRESFLGMEQIKDVHFQMNNAIADELTYVMLPKCTSDRLLGVRAGTHVSHR